MHSQISSWRSHFLSKGGRIVLLQSVLCSMPIYTLSVITPPAGFIAQVNRLCANFFWGSSEDGPKHHWFGWKELFKPLSEGGISLRTLPDICSAFRLKMLWLLHTKDNMWTAYMKEKYCNGLPISAAPLIVKFILSFCSLSKLLLVWPSSPKIKPDTIQLETPDYKGPLLDL